MSGAKPRGGPDLKKYLDRRLAVNLNANRKVVGVLRGYDQFMNLTLEDTEEVLSEKEVNQIGTTVVRGASILQIECLERTTA